MELRKLVRKNADYSKNVALVLNQAENKFKNMKHKTEETKKEFLDIRDRFDEFLELKGSQFNQ